MFKYSFETEFRYQFQNIFKGLVAVERWFKKHRSLAIGIVSAGTGFGTFVIPPVTQLFLNAFDWKITMISLSGFVMVMPIAAVFLDDPPKYDSDEACDKVTEKTSKFIDFSHFRNKSFVSLSAVTFLVYAFFNTAIYFLPELLKDSERDCGSFIALIGIALMFGMVTLGWWADQDVNVIWLNVVCVLGEF